MSCASCKHWTPGTPFGRCNGTPVLTPAEMHKIAAFMTYELTPELRTEPSHYCSLFAEPEPAEITALKDTLADKEAIIRDLKAQLHDRQPVVEEWQRLQNRLTELEVPAALATANGLARLSLELRLNLLLDRFKALK